MRLDETYEPTTARRCRHVPWWTLWLLWPVLAILKWLVPLWLGAVAALLNTLNHSGSVVVAVALIAVGLVLIVRHGKDQEAYNA